MSRAIKTIADAPVVRGVAEPYRSSRGVQRVGREALQWLQSDRSVLCVTHNPGELLDEDVLAGIDVTVVIPALNAQLLRRAIRTLTGSIARGVAARMADEPPQRIVGGWPNSQIADPILPRASASNRLAHVLTLYHYP